MQQQALQPLPQQSALDQILNESVIDISKYNYENNFSAYCPKLNQISQWAGVCFSCYEDHENMTKYLNGDGVIKAINNSEKYMIIDIFNISKGYIANLSKNIDDFLNQEQIAADEFGKRMKYFREQKDIIEQQFMKNSFDEFCKKNKLHETKVQKSFVVQCKQDEVKWVGFCPQCRMNQNHFIQIKIKTTGSFVKSFFIPYSEIINTPDASDYRLIDFNQFQSKFKNYIDKVDGILINKRIEKLNQQNKTLQEINENITKNQKLIKELKQKSVQQENNKKNQQKAVEDNENNMKRLQKDHVILKLYQKQIESGELYDIQIHCASLSDLTTDIGWKVEIKNQIYEEQKNKESIVVSFYGMFNKGKSFLASKLSGKYIDTGYSTQTIGISALYPRGLPKENSIIYLDTAGLETPISHHKQDRIYEKYQGKYDDESLYTKIYEEKLMDRLVTERFIGRFLLNQSNLIVIVVEQLTKDEQKLIKKIIRDQSEESEIVIVHNFNKLNTIEEVKNQIDIDIMNSFENTLKENKQIVHLVIAREKSEAGNKYNPFCYKYLQGKIISLNKFKKFDIIQSLMTEVQKEIANNFQQNSKINNSEENSSQILLYDQNKITTTLQLTQPKSIQFDILGDMFLENETDTVTPKYYYEITDELLVLNVELYGKFKLQNNDKEECYKTLIYKCNTSGCSILKWHGFVNKEQVIKLRAQYQGPVSEKLWKPNKMDERLGRFQLTVPISQNLCVLKQEDTNFSFIQGIARLNSKKK